MVCNGRVYYGGSVEGSTFERTPRCGGRVGRPYWRCSGLECRRECRRCMCFPVAHDRHNFVVQTRTCEDLCVGCRNKISSNQVKDELCTLHSLVGRSMRFPQTGIVGLARTVDVHQSLHSAHFDFSHIVIT